MTIYVDQFPDSGWGKWNGGGHMLGTNIFELHAEARKIGLRKSWFQNKRFPHYDLTRSKRILAIQHGAVEIRFGAIPNDTLVKTRARVDGEGMVIGMRKRPCESRHPLREFYYTLRLFGSGATLVISVFHYAPWYVVITPALATARWLWKANDEALKP